MVILIMGVSSSGKSLIGEKLSDRLGIPFYDADDFHPEDNIKKMESGKPLNDDDRWPWLKILADKLAEWENSGGGILACSALKEGYREVLNSKVEDPKWIYLKGGKELIMERMEDRKDHFMPPALLDSQFKDLEEPEYAYAADISKDPEEIVDGIVQYLGENSK